MSAKIGSMPAQLDPVFIARMACAEYAEIGPYAPRLTTCPARDARADPGARQLAEAAEGNRIWALLAFEWVHRSGGGMVMPVQQR
jgi:hypothetical protein